MEDVTNPKIMPPTISAFTATQSNPIDPTQPWTFEITGTNYDANTSFTIQDTTNVGITNAVTWTPGTVGFGAGGTKTTFKIVTAPSVSAPGIFPPSGTICVTVYEGGSPTAMNGLCKKVFYTERSQLRQFRDIAVALVDFTPENFTFTDQSAIMITGEALDTVDSFSLAEIYAQSVTWTIDETLPVTPEIVVLLATPTRTGLQIDGDGILQVTALITVDESDDESDELSDRQPSIEVSQELRSFAKPVYYETP